MADHDVMIIGGGPAGLTAGIYASRARLKTLLLEKMMPGGQILTSPHLENYPGFSGGVSGAQIIEEMVKQAKRFGLEIRTEAAISIEDKALPLGPSLNGIGKAYPLGLVDRKAYPVDKNKGEKIVKTDKGAYRALAVIFATGAGYSKLNVPGEDKLSGRGVSYCATCDGPLFKNKEVVVVGGGDTAIEEAIHLTNFCARVSVVHRRNELRATKILQERALSNRKINFIWDSVVTEIAGGQKVEGVKVKNVKTDELKTISAQGVFIAVGFKPHTEVAKTLVRTDDKGYIITKDDMSTSREGFFAAGDCRKKLLYQFVTACGDGATAAFAAQKYIESLK